MTEFGRGLMPQQWAGLEELQSASGQNWWKDLLRLWAPSGHSSGSHGLRLALRKGFLNFYRRGQSIARVGFEQSRSGRARAYMAVHHKYVPGATGPEPVYLRFGTEASPYLGEEHLRGWIEGSSPWHGVEKWGVDEVIGCNPGIVDLEMAFPGNALRVDIVALEQAADGIRLVLWEAKPLHSGDLRARSGDAPILGQLAAYRAFCEANGAVIEATYRTTCEALTRFADWAGKSDMLSDLVAQGAQGISLDPAVRLALFRGVRTEDGQRVLVPYPGDWARHRERLSATCIREAENPAELLL